MKDENTDNKKLKSIEMLKKWVSGRRGMYDRGDGERGGVGFWESLLALVTYNASTLRGS